MERATERRTLPELFSRALDRRPERVAVRDERDSLTYGALDRRSNALANAVLEAGLEPGARVATVLSNRVETPIVDVAIFKAGVARLPINPELSSEAIEHVLSDAEPSAIVCGLEYAETVEDALENDSEAPVRIAVGTGTPPEGWRSARSLWADAATTRPDVSVDPDALAGLFYTGGTTGEPKGVRYTQAGLTSNFLAHPPELGFSSSDTGLVTTPTAHSGGTFLLTTLLVGGTVILRQGFDEREFLETVEGNDVTWTFLVPTMLYRLLDGPLDEYDLDGLGNVIYGAAPIRPDRLREAVSRLGPIFTQFYGQTEVPNLVATLDRRDHARALEGETHLFRAAGQPCLQSAIRIVDPETGEERPTGERGEIAATAPYVFDGYHDRPEETARTLVDGWVRTGDVGRLDEEGYLYLLDRRSDVVVTGGMNVYTGEVERVLGECAAVADVAVVGIPHEEWGEAVHAFVVPHEDRGLEVADLHDHAEERLAGYKRPKSIDVLEELPTTPFGKVDKERLKDRYWDGEDRRIG